ncbi:hypothetical protein [Streptomyces sp. NPDC005209]|uniref:hypothetical protein n=1 Tax=Streptomyces sp. NPDC005209 TaxID=3156715 RepID=UPI0033A6E254
MPCQYAHPHDDAPPEDHPEIFTIDLRRFEQRYGAAPQHASWPLHEGANRTL